MPRALPSGPPARSPLVAAVGIDALDIRTGGRDDAARRGRRRLASLVAAEHRVHAGYVVYVTRAVAAQLPRGGVRLVAAPLPGHGPIARAVNRYLWLAVRRRLDGVPRPHRLC